MGLLERTGQAVNVSANPDSSAGENFIGGERVNQTARNLTDYRLIRSGAP